MAFRLDLFVRRFRGPLETIHFLAGLLATLGLVLFAVATFAAIFSPESSWERSVTTYRGATPDEIPGNELELARTLHAELGERFEARPQRWMVGPQSGVELEGADLLVRYYSPRGERHLRFYADSGRVEVERERIGLPMFVNRMHQESLGRRAPGDSLWLWAWSFYLEALIVSLFVLPVTGAGLWLARPRPSRAALATGMVSLLFCGWLWAGLR